MNWSLVSSLIRRQDRPTGLDAEHRAEPQVLADALVHHLLVDTPPSSIGRMRATPQVRILKHAPDAQHLEALGLVRIDQELISHQSPMVFDELQRIVDAGQASLPRHLSRDSPKELVDTETSEQYSSLS